MLFLYAAPRLSLGVVFVFMVTISIADGSGWIVCSTGMLT